MSDLQITAVDGYRFSHRGLDLRESNLDFVLDQRAFGPRQLVVVTARSDWSLLGLAHCDRTDPPEMGLACCLHALSNRADLVVAYSDEPVTLELPQGLEERFAAARATAARYGVELVDWFMCDDIYVQSTRATIDEEGAHPLLTHWPESQ